MKAKKIADKLLQYPNFDVKFCLLEPDGSSCGMGMRTFDIDIKDIGYLSETVKLGPVSELQRNTRAADPLLKEMAEVLGNCEDFLSQLPTLNGFYGLALVEHIRTVLQKHHERESPQC